MAARKRPLSNAELAPALREIALFLEMEDVPFKPRAYEKAAQAIEAARPAARRARIAPAGVKALAHSPASARAIAERIDELLTTGRCAISSDLRRKTPVDVLALTAIEGLGPKAVKVALRASSASATCADLERAARAGKVRGAAALRREERAEDPARDRLRSPARARPHAARARPAARRASIETRARSRSPASQHVAVAGSIRRRHETVGDLDFLVGGPRPAPVSRAFAALPEVAHVLRARRHQDAACASPTGCTLDLRVVPAASFGAALLYFTGQQGAQRGAATHRARRKGSSSTSTASSAARAGSRARPRRRSTRRSASPGSRPSCARTHGEIEAARDGPAAAADRARRRCAATSRCRPTGPTAPTRSRRWRRPRAALGLEYIAITDHTRDLAMARGCDEAKLLEQAEAIAR